MTNPSAASNGSQPSAAGRATGGGWQQTGAADDGWGPATRSTASRRAGGGFTAPPPAPSVPETWQPAPPAADDWSPAGPVSARDQRAARRVDDAAQRPAAYPQPYAAAPERGLPWWAALLLLIAIAGIGGIIDTIGTTQARGGFNVGIVIASVVAILVVKRSHMFPVVIAPPIVYSGAALFQLYLRSSGLKDHKVVYDAMANYLVYGFPAIAAASAAVLIIAGIRLIVRR